MRGGSSGEPALPDGNHEKFVGDSVLELRNAIGKEPRKLRIFVPAPRDLLRDPSLQNTRPMAQQPLAPDVFTREERRIIERHRTPEQVQRFLRGLPYNWERQGDTLRSFREVVRLNTAHCLEAALVAVVV